jgi:hypothetical protein
MNPDTYRVRSERVLEIGYLLSGRKDFCGDRSHMCHFLRQTSPEMDSAFRHGEAPWQERELRTLAPLTLEVERNRNAATSLPKFSVA